MPMKNKFVIFIFVFLNFIVLVGYNNYGSIPHNYKTSTQAINPGDFGGDD
jgi:hypothetical protein